LRGGARPGAGRKKGQVSATTRLAKEALEHAFAILQEDPQTSFPEWCRRNVDDYYKLLFPKLLPVQLHHGGSEGGPLTIVSGVPRNDEDN